MAKLQEETANVFVCYMSLCGRVVAQRIYSPDDNETHRSSSSGINGAASRDLTSFRQFSMCINVRCNTFYLLFWYGKGMLQGSYKGGY